MNENDVNVTFDNETNDATETTGDSKGKLIALVVGAAGTAYLAGQAVGAKLKKGPLQMIKDKREARKAKREQKQLERLEKQQLKLSEKISKCTSTKPEDPTPAAEEPAK